jgi:hypothetical protein
MILPRYPVYIPSKGRFQPVKGSTISVLLRDHVPFRVVVEEEEAEAYRILAGYERVLVLPFSNRGLIASRNWIMDHAIREGHERHWQLDDNIANYERLYRHKRIEAPAGIALRVVEDFTDRYSNIGISGHNYSMFVMDKTTPFITNVHVYSSTLVNNAIPYRWRRRYNDDTDLCLQVLAGGLCTVLVNVFSAHKLPTMTRKGGNTADLYQGDGRAHMARSLERDWPYIVQTKRRFNRPQHVVRNRWGGFDTPLQLKPGIDLSALPETDEYGLRITEATEVRSPRLLRLIEERRRAEAGGV